MDINYIKPLKDTFLFSFKYAPLPFAGAMIIAMVSGFFVPFSVWVNRNIYDGGLAVYNGEITFARYTPYLLLLIASYMLPGLVGAIKNSIIQPNYLLTLRINVRRFITEKYLRMKYIHFEDPDKYNTMDTVYDRMEYALRHMGMGFVPAVITSIVSIIGFAAVLVKAAWWLPITVIAPYFLIEYLRGGYFIRTYGAIDRNREHERKASILVRYMRAREYIKEMKLFKAFPRIRDEYVSRLNYFNRIYEKTYYKNTAAYAPITLILDMSRLINVLLVMFIFLKGEISVGFFIALSTQIFSFSLWFGLAGFRLHSYFFTHYYKFLSFENEEEGAVEGIPGKFEIEFRNVRFKYPQEEKYAVDGVSLKIEAGEKVSLVGENGAGKSTLIKLLLGLYEPESGEIILNGRNILAYTKEARAKLFAPVFQDFIKYSLTLGENIAIGSIGDINNRAAILSAAKKGGAEYIVKELGLEKQIGKEFEGGTDISGGQWQRIALSRAFMGNKPVFLLDEPTSQLDPMAEAELYKQFAGMVGGKTAIFVTHRLGATKITDRILVMEKGRVTEEGNHGELMEIRGIYARMFNAQKQWYEAHS